MAWWTARRHGDLRTLSSATLLPPEVPPGMAVRRLRQVHGDVVVWVDGTEDSGGGGEGGGSGEGGGDPPTGDAMVSRREDTVLGILTADCAAVALGAAEGVHGAVHAGWRGLVGGVVEKAVAAMRAAGAVEVVAGLGPCIGPCCYSFADPAIDELALRYGSALRAVTTDGGQALDLPGAVRAALQGSGARLVVDQADCTSCSPGFWSYRARRDEARQALLVWRRQPT